MGKAADDGVSKIADSELSQMTAACTMSTERRYTKFVSWHSMVLEMTERE